MTTANPLLAETGLPRFSEIRPEHVEPAIDQILADYQASIDSMLASDIDRDFDNTVMLGERLNDRLSRAWSPVSHLHGVMDSDALRKAYSTAQEKIVEFSTALGQNRTLFSAISAVHASPGFDQLPRPARTLVEHEIRDFTLSGVALEEPARSRYREISAELARLSTEFEEAVLDSTDAWSEHITDPVSLPGVPESGLATLHAYASEKNLDGWLVTLKQPSVQAILTYADDRELRARVYRASGTRASELANDGAFDNAARIEKLLALGHESAALLGFANAAVESLETKMAASPEQVLEFLRELAAKAKPLAEAEMVEMREFARTHLNIDDLQPWDTKYAAEKLREQKYSLNEEELKPYFPLPSVLNGLFGVVKSLFGVELRERSGVDTWHADAHYFDLIDAEGAVIAGAYVDLYARSGKRGGAWMDVCASRFRDGDAVQLPVAYLVCNFAPPNGTTPSLLTHDDVITLFHEFGHGLHHILTEVDYPGVSGISGVEWDAVELPSQFMENFAWTREGLDLFASHYRTGEKLPDELFDRMQAARHFQSGMFLARQLEFALFDFRLHLEFDPAVGSRMMQILDEVRAEVAVIHPPSWHRTPHAFTHIFSGGYGAGYYSYLWAEVLSADAFERFEQEGVFSREVGEAYRRAILSVGGSRPAMESFVEFRGREPSPDALLRSYGLID